MKNLRIERQLVVLNAIRENGIKCSDYVELSAEAKDFLVRNTTVYDNLSNGCTIEVMFVDGKFITCEYYNKNVSKTLTEDQFWKAKVAFNI